MVSLYIHFAFHYEYNNKAGQKGFSFLSTVLLMNTMHNAAHNYKSNSLSIHKSVDSAIPHVILTEIEILESKKH